MRHPSFLGIENPPQNVEEGGVPLFYRDEGTLAKGNGGRWHPPLDTLRGKGWVGMRRRAKISTWREGHYPFSMVAGDDHFSVRIIDGRDHFHENVKTVW